MDRQPNQEMKPDRSIQIAGMIIGLLLAAVSQPFGLWLVFHLELQAPKDDNLTHLILYSAYGGTGIGLLVLIISIICFDRAGRKPSCGTKPN